ncbi:MAG: GDP-mannose pyrophosphatase NudK [Flavobacterium sp.]|nr:MAG: GDP-mannose pyrophosphatase NudK [Flavobacterium sp.]
MINNVKLLRTDILSDNWYVLKKITYEYTKADGSKKVQSREAYDRGNGATILLYNLQNKTVVLTRQFRIPTFVNGNQDGMMIEACAGLLDNDNPEACIRRETQEETGYQISKVRKLFELYMSPGSVTEIVHYFIAEYSRDMKVAPGGGVDHEEENIEVLEIPIDRAMKMIGSGEIKDAKTIILLQYVRLHKII